MQGLVSAGSGASLGLVCATVLACEAAPAKKARDAKPQVVTSTFSDVKRIVSITVPAGYGFCAIPGCGHIEGAVPADACSNKRPTGGCCINLVSDPPKASHPNPSLPTYEV